MLSIVIVNHNTGENLKNCISSIFQYENEQEFEIIIVDQNSKDDSREIIEYLSASKNNIKKLYINENVGFSKANNEGVKIAEGKFLLLLNADVIFTESILAKFINLIEKNAEIGAVCPLLIGTNGLFQYRYFQRYPSLLQYVLFYSLISRFFLDNEKLLNRYLENRDIDCNSKKIQFVPQIPFAFFLTRKNIYLENKMMDENFILFFEDVDFCYRLNKKYKIAFSASERITHIGGASIMKNHLFWIYGRFIMSMNYFFDKHYCFLKALTLKILSVANSLVIIVYENIMRIFRKTDLLRLNKHKYFLKEFFKYYF